MHSAIFRPHPRVVGTLAWTLACLLAAGNGYAKDIYVSAYRAGNDANNGASKTTPVRTLARALTLASAGDTLLLTAGRYDGPAISLKFALTVSGSWTEDFGTQARWTAHELESIKPDQELCDKHSCLSASNDDRVLTLAAPGISLNAVVVHGPDRSKVVGSDSFGIVVDGPAASFTQVVVFGGTAGKGHQGTGGGTSSGYCSNGGAGGRAISLGGNGMSGDWCRVQDAGQGESPKLGDRIALGGTGGGSGNNNCSMWPTAIGLSDGNRGNPGAPGVEGPPGSQGASADKGFFGRNNGTLDWATSVVGGNGAPGSAGGGGGGGGAGGSWNVIYWCLVGYPVLGGHGHTGNRGGCAGGGGGGGFSGGAASALVVQGAIVSVEDLVLFGGMGGEGGDGGDGNHGAPGEQDAAVGSAGTTTYGCSNNMSQGGTGGAGGVGGTGGGGGGGSGGNGGPAITLAKINKGGVLQRGGVLRIGAGKFGRPGKGGHSAESKITAPAGGDGIHADSLELELK